MIDYKPRRDKLIVSVTLNPCIDTVMFLDELRIGDTNRVKRVEHDAGGKGINFSRMVHTLGGNTIASGFIGGGTGAHVIAVLDRENVPHDFVQIAGRTRTNVHVETLGPPTCLDEPGPYIHPQELEALLGETAILCDGAAWLSIGGAIPPGVREDIFCVLCEIGHSFGAKVLIDADGEALEKGLKAGPDLIKPNRAEAERLLGRAIKSARETTEAAHQLRKRLIQSHDRSGYQPTVIISLGAEGAAMSSWKGDFVGMSPEVEVSSTIGSGDSMLGAFVWAIEQKHPLEECLRWGLAAGAATAMSDGAQMGSKPCVLDLYSEASEYRAGEECLF